MDINEMTKRMNKRRGENPDGTVKSKCTPCSGINKKAKLKEIYNSAFNNELEKISEKGMASLRPKCKCAKCGCKKGKCDGPCPKCGHK